VKLGDLETRLEVDGFDMRQIRLNRDFWQSNDVYCIEERGGRWAIFYLERGVHFDEQFFPSEEEACEAFLAWASLFSFLKVR
jgi:hypothetical protein